MTAYARQAKDQELILWATEIKVRAERRAGEILATMEKNKGGEARQYTQSHDETGVVDVLLMAVEALLRMAKKRVDDDHQRWVKGQRLAA